MDVDRFLAKYPRLFHVAAGDAWPMIQEDGLLSASALVARSSLDPDDRAKVLGAPRQESLSLDVTGMGKVTLRDQRPLNPAKLSTALTDGMTVERWLGILNGMVFFFPTTVAMDRMLAAYGDDPLLVLTFDTRSLVNEYRSLIRVAAINTGATYHAAAARGAGTFLSISAFKSATVKEVGIEHAVTDAANHVLLAERRNPDGTTQRMYAK